VSQGKEREEMDAWLKLNEPLTAEDLETLDVLLSRLGKVAKEEEKEKILDVRMIVSHKSALMAYQKSE
jgi:hypothetical protein